MAKKYKYNDDAFGSLFNGSLGVFGASLLGGFDPTGILSTLTAFNGGNFIGTGDDIIGSLFFGDPDASSEAWKELSGYNSQQREFEQQEYLIDKQNEYNTPANQMARMKEAGINPNVAAGGIAGAGSVSATPSPVASNVGGAASAAQQLTGAAGTVADIVNKASEANQRNELLDDTKKQLVADTYLKLKEADYTDLQAQALSIGISYMPMEKYLGLMAKVGEINKLSAEYKVFMQDIENKRQEIKESEERINLYKTEGNLNDALALQATTNAEKLDVERSINQWRLDKMKMLNIDPNNPVEVNLFNLGVEGDERYDKGLFILSDTNYHHYSGQYEAYNDSLWDAKYIEEMYYHPTNIVSAISDIRKRFSMKLREYGDSISRTAKAIKLRKWTRSMISDIEEDMTKHDPNSEIYKNLEKTKEHFERQLNLSIDEMIEQYEPVKRPKKHGN